jgi:alpha-1,3-mannosyl-glycoprotein beta-1,2-N-acetylglucosaminyltransferase
MPLSLRQSHPLHTQQPDLSEPQTEAQDRNFVGYYKISRHYKWALTQMFNVRGFDRVIIVEDDLDVAPVSECVCVKRRKWSWFSLSHTHSHTLLHTLIHTHTRMQDFFSYFAYGAQVLDADKSVWCVSAWSDNGLSRHVMDPSRLYRSDFFPGLGWMMPRHIWDELGPSSCVCVCVVGRSGFFNSFFFLKMHVAHTHSHSPSHTLSRSHPPSEWTPKFWDDWMREGPQRRGRVCVRPEVSRTRTFGRVGVSNGQFYDAYLKFILLNSVCFGGVFQCVCIFMCKK